MMALVLAPSRTGMRTTRRQRRDQPQGVGFVKQHDIIDRRQPGQDLRPLRLAQDGPRVALDGPHGTVRVEADHQDIALAPGRRQVTHVPRVQQVEAAVREHDRLAAAPQAAEDGRQFAA